MSKYTKQDIIRMVEDEDVEFIRLQFTDMFGTLKNVAVTSSQLEKALNNECMFDGSSIEGFVRIEESDMYLYPDLDTFCIFPWRPQQGKVARIICDIYTADRQPFSGDPRYVLKKAVADAAQMGYQFDVGPECEFFLFHTDDDGMPTTVSHERAGYLDTSPIDLGENTRRDIILTLEEMGYQITSSHHEIAPAQHEIDFAFEDALSTADKVMTFKMAVRTIAKRYGLHATFMPKPRQDVNGSGLHLHMRLLKNGRNVFTGENGELSTDGEAFLAGILGHVVGMTAVFNPLVNSYKRLVPGFEAPSDVTWSRTQRNALLHVRKRRGEGVDLELRSPDCAANPYLLLALCLEAGLDGIRKQQKAPKELTEDICRLSDEEKKQRKIQSLPENLGVALDAMGQDLLVREVLGESYVAEYQKMKRREWKNYLEQVTKWELEQYLYLV